MHISVLLFTLAFASRESIAQDEARKNIAYKHLVNDVRIAQIRVQEYVKGWQEDCAARGLVLQGDTFGDMTCAPEPKRPEPPKQAPSLPAHPESIPTAKDPQGVPLK